jgi:hypothetical protein
MSDENVIENTNTEAKINTNTIPVVNEENSVAKDSVKGAVNKKL